MSIFSKLKLAKTSKDLEKSVEEIDADIVLCQAEIKALEDSREKVIFEEGEAAVAELQRQLAGKREHLDLLQIARRGAISRQAEAEADEKKREQDSRYRQAVKNAAEERRLLKQWHEAAKELAGITARIAAVQEALHSFNDSMRAAGRSDLIVPKIAREVNARRVELWEAHCAAMGHSSANPPAPIDLDIPKQFQIQHYWPALHVSPGREFSGPPLALLD
jgi:hypothetical protein